MYHEIVFQPILPIVLVLPVLLVLYVLFVLLVLRRGEPRYITVSSLLRTGGILALVLVIDLRPMRVGKDVQIQMRNSDVLFVLDTTESMAAEDADGGKNRLEASVAACKRIMEQMDGGNFALIRFDDYSTVMDPFTRDADLVSEDLDGIDLSESYSLSGMGTDLGTPYDDIKLLLQSSDQKASRKTYLFFFTDGEDDGATQEDVYRELAGYLDGGAIVGVGTEKGAEVTHNNLYSYSYGSNTHVTKLDVQNLRAIARDFGLGYVHLTDAGSLDSTVRLIQMEVMDVDTDSNATTYEDLYIYAAVPLLALLVWEAVLFARGGHL